MNSSKLLTFSFLIFFFSAFTSGQTKEVSLKFQAEDFEFTELNEYLVVSSKANGYYKEHTGEPDLPYFDTKVLVPSGAEFADVKISYELELVHDDALVSPIQQILPLSADTVVPWVEPLSSIYNSSKAYPAEIVKFSSSQKMNQYEFFTFEVCPFVYHPKERKLYLVSRLDINIKYTLQASQRSLAPVRENPLFRNMIESMVTNPEDLASTKMQMRTASFAPHDAEYLIITSPSLAASFERLAYWKMQTGLTTHIITTDSIYAKYTGATNQLKIKNCILDYYLNHGTVWVLLGGDSQVVPDQDTYVSVGGSIEYNMPTDLFYACFDRQYDWNADGDSRVGEPEDNIDMAPEVIISRAPVRSITDADAFTKKSIAYELTPPTSNFANKILLTGVRLWSTLGSISDAQAKTEDMWDSYISPHWATGEKYRFYDTETDFGGASYNVTASNISAQLNSGYNQFFIATHGNTSIWSTESGSSFYSSHAAGLTNSAKQGIITTIACITNAFDQGEPCLSEAFIRNPNGGAVAYNGCSRYGWGYSGTASHGPSFNYSDSFYEYLFAGTGSGNQYKFGSSMTQSKLNYLGSSSTNGAYRWVMFGLNAVGDPHLDIFTDDPVGITSSHIDSIDCAATILEITNCSASDAIATVMFDSVLIGRTQLNGGRGSIVFNQVVLDSEDYITLTITAHNTIPYVAEIPIKSNCTRAPIAQFTVANSESCVDNQIQLVDESVLSPDTWKWEITPSTFSFVNGTNENSQNPLIKCTQLGSYSIKLIVSNTFGSDTLQKQDYIRISPINAAFRHSDSLLNIADTLNLFNISSCKADYLDWKIEPNTYTFINGTNAGSPNPQILFSETGRYEVSLLVSDSLASDSITKVVNVNSTCIMCEESASNAVRGKLFDSGGPSGNYSNNENCTFLIENPCGSPITLSFISFQLEGCCDYFRVYDGTDVSGTLLMSAQGSSLPVPVTASSGTMFISFTTDGSVTYAGFEAEWVMEGVEVPPVAEFEIANNNPLFNSNVQFSNQSENYPNQWLWEFGDGETSTEENPSHVYLSSGVKNIQLIASNCFGSDTITKSLTVQEPPLIEISLDSIETSTLVNDSVKESFTITNNGSGDLVFSIAAYESVQKTTPAGNLLEGIKILDIGYDRSMFHHELRLLGADITLATSDISTQMLEEFDVLIIGDYFFRTYEEFEDIQAWIQNGGSLYIEGNSETEEKNQLLANSGISYNNSPNNEYRTTDITEHPVTRNIDEYYIQNVYRSLSVSGAASSLIRDIDGVTNCAVSQIGRGKIVAVASQSLYSTNINITGHLDLGINAIKWLASPKTWLSISPERDTLVSGESIQVELLFDADGEDPGEYLADIVVSNNDSTNANSLVSAKLEVLSAPNIEISKDTLDFDQKFVNVSSTQKLSILNIGSEDLIIDSIFTDNLKFNADTGNISIIPGDSIQLTVQYLSNEVSHDTGNLYIANNDPRESLRQISLSASSILPPVISVTPDSLNIDLFVEDTLRRNITIDNTSGGSDLYYEVKVTNTAQDVLKNTGNLSSRFEEFGATDIRIDNNLLSYSISGKIENEGKSETFINTQTTPLTNDLSGTNILFHNGDYSAFQIELEAKGAKTTVYSGEITSAVLDTTDVFIIDDYLYPSAAEISTIHNWINQGGRLLLIADNSEYTSNQIIDGSGITCLSTPNTFGITTDLTDHPVTQGIESYEILGGTVGSLLVGGSAIEIITDISGVAHAAVADLGAGRIIAIADETFYGGAYEATGHRQLGLNCVQWLSTDSWMEIHPLGDTVAAGTTSELEVKFDARYTKSGNYQVNIVISSNDPLNSEVKIPVILNVQGFPEIEINPDTLFFEEIYTNRVYTDSISILNSGSEVLVIDSVYTSNSNFNVSDTSLTIGIGDVSNLRVTYLSANGGIDFGELFIRSNAISNPISSVALYAESLAPPVISVLPDSFDVELTAGELVSEVLTIDNTLGGSDLSYSIKVNYGSRTEIQPIVFDNENVESTTNQYSETYSKRRFKAFESNPSPASLGSSKLFGVAVQIDKIVEISPTTGSIIDTIIDAQSASGPEGLAFDGTYLYLANMGEITKIDYQSKTVIDKITLPPSEFYDGLTHDGSNLYVLDYHKGVYQVDFEEGVITDTLLMNSEIWGAITYAGTRGSFFAFSDNSDIYEIDPETGQIFNALSFTPGSLAYAMGYSNSLDLLFVSENNNDIIYAIDPDDGTIQYSFPGAVTGLAGDSYRRAWITPQTYSGTVAAGLSEDVDILFEANEQGAGKYYANLEIICNDPVTPKIIVPTKLDVCAAEFEIDVEGCLDFGGVTPGDTRIEDVTITNTGCDTLFINSISSSSIVFTPLSPQIVLTAGESAQLEIKFDPSSSSSSSETGEILFETNMGTYTLCVEGRKYYMEQQGYTDIFGSITSATTRRALKFRMGEAAGVIHSISMYHQGGSGNMILGVYADDNDKPGELLAKTPVTPANNYADWQTIALEKQPYINAGQEYWLAWSYEQPLTIRYTTGTPGRYDSQEGWTGSMPEDFGAGSSSNYIYSIYMNWSAQTTPRSPDSLTATAIASDMISLSWRDNSTTETGFAIERYLDPDGPFTPIYLHGANITSYTDTALSENTEYFYRLRAVNNTSTSPYTKMVSATTLQDLPPEAPDELEVTPLSSESISLIWNDQSDNETGFEIERSLNHSSGFARIYNTGANVTSYTDSSLSAGTTYFYRIRAFNLSGNSAYSAIDSATTQIPTPPDAPSGLTANALSSSLINLEWNDNSSDETGFEIERSLSSESGYVKIYTTGSDVTSFIDAGLLYGTTYFYRVRAINAIGGSTYSAVDSATTLSPTPPNAPDGLTANALSTSQIHISWNDNSSNESVFEIERSLNFGTGFSTIDTIGSNMTEFLDTGLVSGTAYFYRVRAANADGKSAYSAIDSAITLRPTPPDTPDGLTANALSTSQISISWVDNSSDETGFEIERSLTSGSSFTTIFTTGSNATSYTDIGLLPGTTYFYRVRAVNAAGNSAYSAEADATTSIDQPEEDHGFTDIFGSITSASTRRAQLLYMPEDGTIQSITMYHQGTHGNMILAVYDDNGGAPGNRIASTPVSTANSSAGWQSIDLFTPIAVSAGESIWLAWVYEHAPTIRYQSGAPGRAASNEGWSGGMPTSFGSSSVANYTYSIYMTYSSTPDLPPVAPDGLTAAANSAEQIEVNWNDNSNNEAGFELERSLNLNSGFVTIYSSDEDVTNYIDSGLKNGTTYFYRVRAFNAAGISTYSAVDSATTLIPTPPDAPDALTANALSSSQISLEWDDNSFNESGFEIERSLSSGIGFSIIHTTASNATSFVDAGLLPGTTYFYRVRAVNSVGHSAYTTEVNATTGIADLEKDHGFTDIFNSITSASTRRAQAVIMPEDGTIQSITMYHQGGGGDMILAIYEDNGGVPGNRIAITPAEAVNSSAGWQSIDLTSPVSVSSGETIWLAWVYEYAPTIRYQSGTPGRAASDQGWSGGMPTSFGGSSVASYTYSIYMTYVPGSAPVMKRNQQITNQPMEATEPITESVEIFIYPNPFTDYLTIDYHLPNSAEVKVEFYNLAGERLFNALEEFQHEGKQQLVINRADLNQTQFLPGIYLLRIEAGEHIQFFKIMAK